MSKNGSVTATTHRELKRKLNSRIAELQAELGIMTARCDKAEDNFCDAVTELDKLKAEMEGGE